eukprot:3385820-Pleurochrysis_carterae.AAC.1
MRELGSSADSPTTPCSWLRSSTAPRESSPASSNGSSASTALPAVALTKPWIVSMLTDTAATCTAPRRPLGAGGTTAASSCGGAPAPTNLRQRTGKTPSTGGAGCSARRSAVRPCTLEMSEMPDARIRVRTTSLTAIPTSPHGPHCTLTERRPREAPSAASASRHALAAA